MASSTASTPSKLDGPACRRPTTRGCLRLACVDVCHEPTEPSRRRRRARRDHDACASPSPARRADGPGADRSGARRTRPRARRRARRRRQPADRRAMRAPTLGPRDRRRRSAADVDAGLRARRRADRLHAARGHAGAPGGLRARTACALVIGTTGFNAAQKAAMADRATAHPDRVRAEHERRRQRAARAASSSRRARLGPATTSRSSRCTTATRSTRRRGTALGLGEAAAARRGRDAGRLRRLRARGRHRRARARRPSASPTLRGGDIVGDHTVIFAGTGERIEISRTARRRARTSPRAHCAPRAMSPAGRRGCTASHDARTCSVERAARRSRGGRAGGAANLPAQRVRGIMRGLRSGNEPLPVPASHVNATRARLPVVVPVRTRGDSPILRRRPAMPHVARRSRPRPALLFRRGARQSSRSPTARSSAACRSAPTAASPARWCSTRR